MDAGLQGSCPSALRLRSRQQHAVAAAVLVLACGATVPDPAAAQTVVSAGQTLDLFNGPTDLGELRMEGGQLILRSPVHRATGSKLANGLITAPGIGLQLELHGDTTIPGAPFGPYPEDGMYISASAAELQFPLDVINKGQVFQTGNGRLTLGGGARFINDQGSTYWIRNDLGVERTSALASASFVNRGSVIKGGTGTGTGTSVFRVPVAQDGGKFETWQGAIQFALGGNFNDATFYADGLGGNPVQNGIIFNGSSSFTGVLTTDTGNFLLTERSQIRLGPGPLLDFWIQRANFRVQGFESLIDIAAGATLHNTGTLDTAFGGALTGGASGPVEQGSPTRGLLHNARSFDGLQAGAFGGVILGERLDPPFPPDFPQFRLIDVQNDRGTEFLFRPVSPADFDPARFSETNLVGSFANEGRVRIAPVIDVFGVTPTVVEAGTFTQDQQGPPVFGQTAELLIEQDAELRASTFRQLGGTTVVNGVLRAGSTYFNGASVPGAVEFLGGFVEGNGFIYHESNLLSAVIFGPDLKVRPGNSPGILTIDGDLEATGTTFDIEIAGPDAGTLFDQLIVNGQARFDGGILNLRFIDGFVPTENDVFQWLVASGGLFGSETLTVNVFSDLAFIDGSLDEYGRFIVASVVPVPLPPAAWALGTALAALGGLARRRSAAA